MGSIQFLHCNIDNMQRSVTIKPRGRNILIVGQNGSGKTSFLVKLSEGLRDYLNHGHSTEKHNKSQIKDYLKHIKSYPEHEQSYLVQIKDLRDTWKKQRKSIFFKISDVENLSKLTRKNLIVMKFFKAHRKAAIKKVTSVSGSVNGSISSFGNSELAADLEQHLVNLRVRAALAFLKDGEDSRAETIEKWFDKFESDIQYLFENDTVRLKFDADQMRYYITQEGRLDYSFQELSSGYSAIFDIFGDLVVRAEYLDLTPKELSGIVIIDEIDAHLHVSLQRKILPFFIRSFPNIQFIVSTHSPFVLSSVDDVLIYDISSGHSALDLSMYSIDAITEGLLGVPPISKKLEETIKSLSEITNREDFDLAVAAEIISRLSPFSDSLDDESKMHYEIARNKVLREKARGSDV
ncbi:ATP-binding protein [Pseudomonas sp. S8]|uniref:AAA family ATPase n=1 Tax=Pseudomonas sp. S8 TaxID=211136 RepID=UPI003D29F8DE